MPTTLPAHRRCRRAPDLLAPLAFASIPFVFLLAVAMIETRGRPAATDFADTLDRAAIGIGMLEGAPTPSPPDRRGRMRFAAHAMLHRPDR